MLYSGNHCSACLLKKWLGFASPSSVMRVLGLVAVLCALSCSSSDTPPATGNIDSFVAALEKDDFCVTEGDVHQIDILKIVSEGFLHSAYGNNAGFPYAAFLLPAAPAQNPATGQAPSKCYNPDDPNNFPATPDSYPPGISYKLRDDEAIVLIGKTPPKARYFSYRSYLGFTQNKPGKDYTNVDVWHDPLGTAYHRIFASLGDPLNHLTISALSTFDSPMVLIVSADKRVNARVRRALEQTGYPSGIINDDVIPSDMVRMGLETGKDAFIFLIRAALWDNDAAGKKFMVNCSDTTGPCEKSMRVFRVSPRNPAPVDPYPVPTLRLRGNGVSEYEIVPSVNQDLDTLRLGILNAYASQDYDTIELPTEIWIPEGFVGIAQDIDVIGEDRDTTYLKSIEFYLHSDDDFIIAYGVNHEQTGKATYSNFSFYGLDLLNGVTGSNSSVFVNSAVPFFPDKYKNAGYYYAYKLSRKKGCPDPEKENRCVSIPVSTGNPDGKAFGVDNEKCAFLTYRAYIEKENKIGPAPFELVYDKAILFTKKNKDNPYDPTRCVQQPGSLQ